MLESNEFNDAGDVRDEFGVSREGETTEDVVEDSRGVCIVRVGTRGVEQGES